MLSRLDILSNEVSQYNGTARELTPVYKEVYEKGYTELENQRNEIFELSEFDKSSIDLVDTMEIHLAPADKEFYVYKQIKEDGSYTYFDSTYSLGNTQNCELVDKIEIAENIPAQYFMGLQYIDNSGNYQLRYYANEDIDEERYKYYKYEGKYYYLTAGMRDGTWGGGNPDGNHIEADAGKTTMRIDEYYQGYEHGYMYLMAFEYYPGLRYVINNDFNYFKNGLKKNPQLCDEYGGIRKGKNQDQYIIDHLEYDKTKEYRGFPNGYALATGPSTNSNNTNRMKLEVPFIGHKKNQKNIFIRDKSNIAIINNIYEPPARWEYVGPSVSGKSNNYYRREVLQIPRDKCNIEYGPYGKDAYQAARVSGYRQRDDYQRVHKWNEGPDFSYKYIGEEGKGEGTYGTKTVREFNQVELQLYGKYIINIDENGQYIDNGEEEMPIIEIEDKYVPSAFIENLYLNKGQNTIQEGYNNEDGYYYIKKDDIIYTYNFTDNYINISDTDINAFPEKGIIQYGDKGYGITYKDKEYPIIDSYNEDTLLSNIDYLQDLGTSDNFTIGTVGGASIKFKIGKPIAEILPYVNHQCIYYQRYNKEKQYENQGVFTIKEIEENGFNQTTVIAYDNTEKLNVDAKPVLKQLYYPLTIFQLFVIICAYCDIPYDLNTYFPNMTLSIPKEILPGENNSEITCRNILEGIAQIAGGCFIADFDGCLVFKDLHKTNIVYGSRENTNYKVNISQIPILKPTKIQYENISFTTRVSDQIDVNINTVDCSGNLLLAALDNEDLLKQTLKTTLKSIENIGDIYPVSCHIDNNNTNRQCGDAGVVESGEKIYPCIITQIHIDSNGIDFSCDGKVIPYYKERNLEEDEVNDIVNKYHNTFFRFYYNSIVVQDMFAKTMREYTDVYGYIDEQNLKIPNLNLSPISSNYTMDFTACVNELLVKKGIDVYVGDSIYVSFIDGVLYVRCMNIIDGDLSGVKNTVFRYRITPENSYHYGNHNYNQNTSVSSEGRYTLAIKNVITGDNHLDVEPTRSMFYKISMLFKNYGNSYMTTPEIISDHIYRVYTDKDKTAYFDFYLLVNELYFNFNGIEIGYNSTEDIVSFEIDVEAPTTFDSENVNDYIYISVLGMEQKKLEGEYIKTASGLPDTYSLGNLYLPVFSYNGTNEGDGTFGFGNQYLRGKYVAKAYNGAYVYAIADRNKPIVIKYEEGRPIKATYNGIELNQRCCRIAENKYQIIIFANNTILKWHKNKTNYKEYNTDITYTENKYSIIDFFCRYGGLKYTFDNINGISAFQDTEDANKKGGIRYIIPRTIRLLAHNGEYELFRYNYLGEGNNKDDLFIISNNGYELTTYTFQYNDEITTVSFEVNQSQSLLEPMEIGIKGYISNPKFVLDHVSIEENAIYLRYLGETILDYD